MALPATKSSRARMRLLPRYTPELPHDTEQLTQSQRLRLIRVETLKSRPDALEQRHQPPQWFEKRALSSTPSAAQSIDGGLKSSDPARIKEMQHRLLLHFNYKAERAIRKYFTIKPTSPLSFEEIYSAMLSKIFPKFITPNYPLPARRRMADISFTINSPKGVVSFERQFVDDVNRPGAFSKREKPQVLRTFRRLDRGIRTPTISPNHRAKLRKILTGNLLSTKQKRHISLIFFQGKSLQEAWKEISPKIGRTGYVNFHDRTMKKIQELFRLPLASIIAARNRTTYENPETRKIRIQIKRIAHGLLEGSKKEELEAFLKRPMFTIHDLRLMVRQGKVNYLLSSLVATEIVRNLKEKKIISRNRGKTSVYSVLHPHL